MASKPTGLQPSSCPPSISPRAKSQHDGHLVGASPRKRPGDQLLRDGDTSKALDGVDTKELTPTRSVLDIHCNSILPSSSSNEFKRQRLESPEEQGSWSKSDPRRISLEADDIQDNPPKLAANGSLPPDSGENAGDYDDDSSVEILLTIQPPTPKKMPEIATDNGTNAENKTIQFNTADEVVVSNEGPPMSLSDAAMKRQSPDITTQGNEDKRDDQLHNPHSTVPMNANNDTPMLQSPKSASKSPFEEEDRLSESEETPVQLCATDEDRKMPARPTPGPDGLDIDSMQSTSTANREQNQQYSFLTSAYVQNLAEICHTILEDRRWRVGMSSKPLFAWEYGDDLSAVIPLARRFRPVYSRETQKPVCQGLPWCPNNEQVNSAASLFKSSTPSDSPDAQKPAATAASPAPLPSHPENSDYSSSEGATDPPEDGEMKESEMDTTTIEKSSNNARDDDIDEAEHRCIHLYCRLYYRKGPWYRVDDLYSRYYAPKQPGGDQGVAGQRRSTVFDEGLFQKHCEALNVCLGDVTRLKEMGLIRQFLSEKECGQTVGTSCGPLTTEERSALLGKLGGGKKKATKKGLPNATTDRGGKTSSSASRENEIWRQMRLQKSLSAHFRPSNSAEKGSLLPVLRHVNHLLVEKLAARVAQACGSSRKDHRTRVKKTIAGFLADCPTHPFLNEPQMNALFGKFGMCVRLREAPLRSLQRCSRLYMCAGGGPGQMRSDGGTNGWKSILEVDLTRVKANTKLKDAKYAMNVEPPGSHSWHNVRYPGLQHRFGLTSCSFVEAYRPLPQGEVQLGKNDQSELAPEQVFVSRQAFASWEVCVELRAHADYLIEVNELLLYNERKRAREEVANGIMDQDKSSDEDQDRDGKIPATGSTLDFLNLLSVDGRKALVTAFMDSDSRQLMQSTSYPEIAKVEQELEGDVQNLFEVAPGATSHPMKTECEEVLCIMAALIKHILKWRIGSIPLSHLRATVSRPWLRHMSYEACLSYVLWDCIPILERRGFYAFAFQSLELLRSGRCVPECPALAQGGVLGQLKVMASTKGERLKEAFARFLLSRRARGKAMDRLVVDGSHILRRELKAIDAAEAGKKKGKKKKGSSGNPVAGTVASFSREALLGVLATASISFASVRTLARRIRQPLLKTIESLEPSQEAQELGLRLGCPKLGRFVENAKKYSDWVPQTDHAVANSVAIEESMVGRRCSFVGHEDDEKRSTPSSLNVEQLAMEFYASGRLPKAQSDGEVKGGWKGWHDEGGMVRALFRVLSHHVLEMDWACRHAIEGDSSASELSTIHLSPYQGAPFDLHVGYELSDDPFHGVESAFSVNRGFYLRRREKIDGFLKALEAMSRQEVSDLVWHSISARHRYMSARFQKDPSIEKDVLQCRTLSMVAAGFGGKMLSSMFRCFFFDYRHYSGGLPDLLLVRATQQQPASKATLVDLGEWVGEAFDAQYLAELEADQLSSLLGDRDDDFLGCNKVGDSSANSRGRSNIRPRSGQPNRRDSAANGTNTNLPTLPARLLLVHSGADVNVECMFCEVKSLNDRLDARQEDWLNILDLHGNARVCKFGDGKESKKKAKKTDAATDRTKLDSQ